MRGRLPGPVRLRALGTGLLLAPAVSLVVARLAVGLAGSIRALPAGMHTYLPAADVLPIPWLVALALAGTLAAVATWRRARIRLGGAVLVLLAGQAVFHLLQLALIDRLQGVPDAAGPVVLGLAVPALLLLLIALALGGAGHLLFEPPSVSPRPPRFGTPIQALVGPRLQLVPVRIDGGPSRRGPPARFSR